MTRWFRHYAGMQRDDKLVRAAVRSKQTVERVVWVWGALLESAAEINDAGRFDFDVDEAAYFLRCDPGDLASIVGALCDLGRVSDGKVTKWGDRQFDSDASRERQQRYRDRKKSSHGDDGDVTLPSPDGGVTLQETDTDTKPEDKIARPVVDAVGARVSFDEIWKVFPRNPTSSEPAAEAAYNATRPKDRPLILAAALRTRQWFTEDNLERGRTDDAGAKFMPHLFNWITDGKWRNAGSLPIKAEASTPDPSLAVVDAGSDDFQAIARLRGKTPLVGNSGTITVRKSELEQARAAA